MKILSIQQASAKLKGILPADIQILANAFQLAGFDLFLVGGCIRDAFMDKAPKDFDVCTNAMSEVVMEILSNNNINFQLQGEAFGVVVARMSEDIEIATFRTDVSANTGRNSDDSVVLGVTINEDVARRDLTINALFMNLQTGEIIDLVGGVDDLNAGIVRTVGVPAERFAEDNLRKLRAVRFATRLGFSMAPSTLQAIQDNPSLNVSAERIVNELQNAFDKALDVEDLMIQLVATRLISNILPRFKLVNSKAFNVEGVTDFTTFIAAFINAKDLDLGSLERALLNLKFSAKVSAGVRFLFTFDGSCTTPILFKKKMQQTLLTADSIAEFHNDEALRVMAELQLPEGLAQSLMDQGITGKDLGAAMEQAAFEFFETQAI
jgi:tRNA nucleotidyltransferase/poly(A) polymerase